MASFTVSSRFANAIMESAHAQDWIIQCYPNLNYTNRNMRVIHKTLKGDKAKSAFNHMFRDMYECVSVVYSDRCDCCRHRVFSLKG